MVKSGIVERTKGFFARSGGGRNNNNNNKNIFSIVKQDDDPAVLLLSNQNKNQHGPTIPEEASTTTNHNNNVKTTFVGRMPEQQGNDDKNNEEDIPPVVIVGAGIVGLVLALALDKHCGIQAEVYEQAPAFHDDVGAGMGMYPNGLRVIRDISPKLLEQIQQAGCPYVIRRYERHDGTEVATSDERKLLSPDDDSTNNEELEGKDLLLPLGIRRWRLQKILYQAVQEAGITIHFNKRLESLEQKIVSNSNTTAATPPEVRLQFTDGTVQRTRLLLGADGSKSQVRTLVSGGKYQLQYSGTTCIMGSATVPRLVRGLCLPSSETTRCHGAFYPTGEQEQCFQFHFPSTFTLDHPPKENKEEEKHPEDGKDQPVVVDPKAFSWGGLTHTVEQEECNRLADRLFQDGWDEKYIQPLRHVDKALKIGFSTLEPHLESYVFGGRIALVGDSAHPPVPYLGQGAQQGLEDAGTLALLLQHFCTPDYSSDDAQDTTSSSKSSTFAFDQLEPALQLYDKLRLPRTAETLDRSKLWGRQQQKRAENHKYNQVREENIRREIFYHEALPILLPAIRHDYREEVQAALLLIAAAAAAAAAHPPSSSENDKHAATSTSRNNPAVHSEDDHHLISVPEETVLVQ